MRPRPRENPGSKPFVSLCGLLAELPVRNAILDGELDCLGPDGRSQFMELMRRRRQDVCYYAFDLLWLNGVDLRPLPLLERKQRLRELIHGQPGFLYADHVQGKAIELFKACCAKDLEGIVIKHCRGPYNETPRSWLKVLNNSYTQKRGRRELFDKFREQKHGVQNRTAIV